MRQFSAEVITAGGARQRGRRRTLAASPGERLAAGLVCFAAVLWPAVSGGGDDVVVRHELGLAIWWGLALALAFGVVPRARHGRAVRTAASAFAVMVVLTALGLVGTDSVGATADELARLLVYGGALAAVWMAVGPGTWRAAAAGVAAAALTLPLLSIVWRLGLVGDLGADPAFFSDRLLYPLGHWNGLAAWSAGSFALAVALSAHLRSRGWKGAAAAAMPVCGLALYLTASRGGLAALAVALVAVVTLARAPLACAAHAGLGLAATAVAVLAVRGEPAIAEGFGGEGGWLVAVVLAGAAATCALGVRLSAARGLHRRSVSAALRRAGLAVAAGVGIAVVAALVVSIVEPSPDVGERGPYATESADPAARLASLESGRAEIWRVAVDQVAEQPLTGTGAGTFGLRWGESREGGEFVRDAHSLVLETAAELGIPGLIALAGFAVALFVAALRTIAGLRDRADAGLAIGLVGVAAAFFVQAAVDWLWELTGLALLALLSLAVVSSAAAEPTRGRRWPGWARAAGCVAAVMAGAALVPSLVSETRSRAAVDAFRAGAPSAALDYADDAVDARPWAAEPRALRAELELLDRQVAAAGADAAAAIDREPLAWRHRLLLARIEVAARDTDAARAALVAAERLGAPPATGISRRIAALEAGG